MLTPLDKTYISLGLVALALVELLTAMYLFGSKPEGPRRFAKLSLRLHRIFGYVFLVYWLWVMWIGIDLLGRLYSGGAMHDFTGGRFYHAMLAVVLLLILLFKIAFVRFWKNYRLHAKWMGIVLTIGTLTVWLIAGLFWLIMMSGTVHPVE